MPRPRDIVMKRPSILFVGINPGATSGTVGHHFAGPGNTFWKLLHASKLTPVQLAPSEDGRLVEFGYGLVNLVARTTNKASELTRAEMVKGRAQLMKKVKSMRPKVIALVGVTLYPIVCGRGGPPGAGAKPDVLEGARVFVVPNPSGLNATFPTFAAKLRWFEELYRFANDLV